VSAPVVQLSKLMGEGGRVLAGGVWAAWWWMCEAVLLSAACVEVGDEVFRDVPGCAGTGPGLLRRPIGGGSMVGMVYRGF
jgi:hypothetical protein